ncbi:MTRF1L release factor glutamine methyltransferase isoform X1 [Scyliorhinus canicula]|uniref:MTRF1L release factor glutamine methyltransferase isoform X1 n=2 Tax=Scyliorhinus canicula TaxID=7830 RepID=UPI0018F42010|nr:MTRF1L release factor glutamine methyltransferase isoform X1 [Scyliorhinus canicula]XP_038668191.1 MTRF1L release factor glutamine methyltransferase isoform X1 [Scyliorhinus canicula]XP_038668193.1 MTRF1L release factor glutamine methyltransferase isoform X1 [Scyliorhinus canicula]XP_038668194.1 MTRF1L release factor glutamine methyltransferase isoform X1 [Scyliorhinus canicula]XP_038668195.1 MTRF1L release factor glutamine methyltransferase isoform X1 [Scyliorhinus canicula]
MRRKIFFGCRVSLASCFRAQSHCHNRSDLATFHWAVSLTAPNKNLCQLVHETMTGANCVTHWQRIFEQNGISEPQYSSEHIISHVLGGKTIHSLAEKALTRPLTVEQKQMIWNLCLKRLQHVPVQYVIEEWDFRELTLKMKPPVFIPRPETEELVSLVLSELAEEEDVLFSVGKTRWQNSQQAYHPLFLEIGCGSGAIVLSLLHFFLQSRAVAVDKSQEAVDLTRQNAERLCVQHRLQELQLDVLSDSQKLTRICGPVDVIVSNPPYLFHEDMSGLMPEILKYEDHDALDGGADGLDVIKAILQLASTVLKDHGKIFLEVDPRHPEMIQNWLQERASLRLTYRATHWDICGRPRFCVLQRS